MGVDVGIGVGHSPLNPYPNTLTHLVYWISVKNNFWEERKKKQIHVIFIFKGPLGQKKTNLIGFTMVFDGFTAVFLKRLTQKNS